MPADAVVSAIVENFDYSDISTLMAEFEKRKKPIEEKIQALSET